MPWRSKDATRHTRKAKSPKRKRQWAHVADSVLKRTGDEGRAVREANAVVKRGTQVKGRSNGIHRKPKRRSKSGGKRGNKKG